MSKLAVYASGIQDLTVARYIAARDVVFAGFSVNASNLKSIKEIIDWIEGPYIVLEIADPAILEEAAVSIKSHYVHDLSNDEWIEGNTPCEIAPPSILSINERSELFSMRIAGENLYVQGPSIDADFIDQLSAIACGLVVNCGTEEAVGIKSFDEMDEIFDALED